MVIDGFVVAIVVGGIFFIIAEFILGTLQINTNSCILGILSILLDKLINASNSTKFISKSKGFTLFPKASFNVFFLNSN